MLPRAKDYQNRMPHGISRVAYRLLSLYYFARKIQNGGLKEEFPRRFKIIHDFTSARAIVNLSQAKYRTMGGDVFY
jgi:hypothetical protein